MSPLTAIIAVLGCAVTLWAWWLMMRVGREYASSVLRYRLWRLRDRLVDDMFAGAMPQSPAVDDLLRLIEGTIRRAPELTMLNWALLPRDSDAAAKSRRRVDAALREMTAEQQACWHAYCAEFLNVIMGHLLRGSFLGWALNVVFQIVITIDRTRQTVVVVRNRLLKPDKLVRLADASTGGRSLSLCVG